MKKIAGLILTVVLAATCVYAQQQPPAPQQQSGQQQHQPFTGNDYLKLSKKQRVAMVSKMINDAGKAGIGIQKTPVYYCQAIDNFYEKSPKMKDQPFNNVFKTLIIMEYDWDQQGVDKEVLAKKWLGDDLYKSNKARIQSQKK